MSVRVYINTKKLPEGWRVEPIDLRVSILRGDGRKITLFVDGFGYHTQSSSEVVTEIPDDLLPAVCQVTHVERVLDGRHIAIIHCGEHDSADSATATVIRGYKYLDASCRTRQDYVDISVVGKTPSDVAILYHAILTGRKAERPYYPVRWYHRLANWWERVQPGATLEH